MERVLIRLESLYVDLIEIDLCQCSVLSNVFEACQLLRESLEPPLTCTRGRPAFDIHCSCIENLMEIKFTTADIAYPWSFEKYSVQTNETIWTLVFKKLLLH